MFKHIITLFFFKFLLLSFFCQNSNNNLFEEAFPLCYGQTISSNNANSNSTHSSNNFNFDSLINCVKLDNSSWFKFTTNEIGGMVDIIINQINCIGDSNLVFQNNIEVVPLYFINSSSGLVVDLVDNCQTSNSNISFSFSDLLPNQVYYLLIDGYNAIDTIPISTICSYQIQISGSGLKPAIDAGEDMFVFPGEEFQLSGFGIGNPNWYPTSFLDSSNSLTPYLTISSTTEFLLTLTEDGGCVYEDRVKIFAQIPLVFFNTITPNNDGKNDQWRIKNIENYPFCRLEIFNKWGQIVYQSIGYKENQRWNGTFNEKQLPAGTYFYVLDVGSNSNSEIYRGTINLLR